MAYAHNPFYFFFSFHVTMQRFTWAKKNPKRHFLKKKMPRLQDFEQWNGAE